MISATTLSISISALLLASAVASAPHPAKRSVAAIPVTRRATFETHAKKPFNAGAAHHERSMLRAKYTAGKVVNPPAVRGHHKRSVVERDLPDIRMMRRDGEEANPLPELSGVDVLTDADESDELYYGNLSIGTPPQVITVDFDTGSSDLVVPLSDCVGNCTGPLFDATKSSTYVPTDVKFGIQYEDKSGASGIVANETVSIAGITVQKQTFGAVSSEIGGFSGPNAGLIGLGFAANSASNSTPFFQRLVDDDQLAAPVFSFYLARHGGNGSELCIGCRNSERYTGGIVYHPLDFHATNGTLYYWNVASEGLSYNGTKPTTPIHAIIDSGTTLIYTPSDIAKALYDQIPNSAPAPAEVGPGFYTIPCDEMANVGSVAFSFNNKQYPINPEDFNLGPVNATSSLCVGGVAGEDSADGLTIIGDEWMKNWYTVFDLAYFQVGIAKAI